MLQIDGDGGYHERSGCRGAALGSVRDYDGRRARLAARLRPRLIGWAFVALTVGSLIWIGIGYLSDEHALMAQNIAITLINLFGIYRWLIWKGKI